MTNSDPKIYCDVSSRLTVSKQDILTEITKRGIIKHNLTYERLCK